MQLSGSQYSKISNLNLLWPYLIKAKYIMLFVFLASLVKKLIEK